MRVLRCHHRRGSAIARINDSTPPNPFLGQFGFIPSTFRRFRVPRCCPQRRDSNVCSIRIPRRRSQQSTRESSRLWCLAHKEAWYPWACCFVTKQFRFCSIFQMERCLWTYCFEGSIGQDSEGLEDLWATSLKVGCCWFSARQDSSGPLALSA